MYLSTLELHGFKSFAASTVVKFAPGITAVVGPNGCGKSNVVDAIRWVIGEQRARVLRSAKMDDVIFNGSATRRPLGLVEVKLTIENTDGVLPTEYSEVAIGRRLFRSGDSEYLLNGTSCRLRDITDLFLDTGMGPGAYSVMELKMVEQILSDPAKGRRILIEEAAGISKYKKTRNQTARKLEGVEADLSRVEELQREIERRVRTLERQAAAAERLRDIIRQVDSLRLGLAAADYRRLAAETDALVVRLAELKQLSAVKAETLSLAEKQLSAERRQLASREVKAASLAQKLSDHVSRLQGLEADLRIEQQRANSARQEAARLRVEIRDDKAQEQAIGLEMEQIATRLKTELPDLQGKKKVLGTCKTERRVSREAVDQARTNVRLMRKKEDECRTVLGNAVRQRDRLASRLELLQERQARLIAQVRKADKDCNRAAKLVATANRATTAAEKGHRAASAKLAKVQVDWKHARSALDQAQRHQRELQTALEARVAERKLLEQFMTAFEGFSDAVRFLAGTPLGESGRVRVLGDLFTTTTRYHRALEAAMDPWVDCMVVASEEDLRTCIGLLQENKRGSASFFVMSRIPEHEEKVVLPDSLLTHVRILDVQYAPLARVLFGGVRMTTAATRGCYVTTAGEWGDERGFVRAGGDRPGPSRSRMQRRNELEAATSECAQLELQSAELREAVGGLKQEVRAASSDAAAAAERKALERVEEAKRRAYRDESEHDAAQRRLKGIQEQLEHVRRDNATLQAGAQSDSVRQLEVIAEQAHELAEEAERSMEKLEVEHREVIERTGRAQATAAAAATAHEQLKRQRSRMSDRLASQRSRAARRQQRRKTVDKIAADAAKAMDTLTREAETVKCQWPALEEEVSIARREQLEARASLLRAETALRAAHTAKDDAIQTENTEAVRLATLEARLAAHNQQIPGVDRAEPVEDEEVAAEELERLKGRLAAMGKVNALAVEEYAAEQERLTFLEDQSDDLCRARKTLTATFHEINRTAAQRFMDTFLAIEKSFTSLFKELFGGDARGRLLLTDPKDPLESAIAIEAKPRGKRTIRIAQLSSGEKTLTAIALLFAIYLVKPSPFCILDEVDAPLDESNVERYMRLIRRFSSDTQFVLVTHNRRTMEMADRLYGVTMQQEGISSIVGVQLDAARKLVAS